VKDNDTYSDMFPDSSFSVENISFLSTDDSQLSTCSQDSILSSQSLSSSKKFKKKKLSQMDSFITDLLSSCCPNECTYDIPVNGCYFLFFFF